MPPRIGDASRAGHFIETSYVNGGATRRTTAPLEERPAIRYVERVEERSRRRSEDEGAE